MENDIQNLIISIATRNPVIFNKVKITDELYKACDDYYLKKTNRLPTWARKKLEDIEKKIYTRR